MHTLCKLEWDRMPYVYTVGRGPAARVQEEGLAALIAVENELEVSVGKDNASPEEVVRALAGYALEAGKKFIVDLLGAELVN